MTARPLVLALILGMVSLPLSCGGDDDSAPPASGNKSGGAGKAGASGKGGTSGGTGTGGKSSGGSAGSGFVAGAGGRAPGFGGQGGTNAFGGRGGSGATGNTANTGDTGEGGAQNTGGADLGGARRLPFCKTVCAYGPSDAARLISADAGAAGETASAGGAPGAGGSAENGGAPGSAGATENGGAAGESEAAGAGGEGNTVACGNFDACVASLCPAQGSEHCGELLTSYVECMANADPSLVASLVTSCTPSNGPSLDGLIYQSCYDVYANWTRSCL